VYDAFGLTGVGTTKQVFTASLAVLGSVIAAADVVRSLSASCHCCSREVDGCRCLPLTNSLAISVVVRSIGRRIIRRSLKVFSGPEVWSDRVSGWESWRLDLALR